MIVARLIPTIMMLGTASFGLVVAMLLAGMLGYFYFAFPVSHTPAPAPVERILPDLLPVPAAEQRVPRDGMV